MGLNLKPLGNILHAIATPIEDVGKGAVDLGSMIAAGYTGNSQAFDNSSQALTNAARSATHGPASNFIGTNVVKPLIQAPVDVSSQIYNNAIAPMIGAPQFNNPQTEPAPIVKKIAKFSGATGSLHQTLASSAQTALTIGSGGIGNAIEGLAGKATASKLLPKVLSNASITGGYSGAAAAGQGASPGQVAEATGAGTLLSGALPAAGALIRKGVGGTLNKLDKATAPPPDTAVATAASDTPQTAVQLKQAGQSAAQVAPNESPILPRPTTPTGMVAAPKIPPSNTGIPEIDNAINDVANLQSKPTEFSGMAQDVVSQASGVSTIGQRASNKLGKALSDNLTKEENQAVEDVLDGHPTSDATPLVLDVANALRPIRGQALAIRTAIDPKVGEVQQYSPRIPSRSLTTNSVSQGDSVLGKIRSLADIHNLASSFSKERLNDKFVSSNGHTLIGSSKDFGLTDQGNGVFKDANGRVFNRLHATKQELTDAGQGSYERKTSAVNRIYHSDTLSLKARGEAVQALNKDPNSYGLYTEDQIARGEGPKNAVPVTKVKGLTDANGGLLYGSKGDVKALEDKFGYKNAEDNIVLKGYDTATNVVTKFIVLNPLFHGMNQLYQTAIAAGNLPGMGNGWLRVAKGVLTANEQDVRDMLEHGGHSPTYGADMENILSKVTKGTTKLPSKGMAAIEIRLRTGLYKASVDSGMAPKAAVKNIDTFLGDSKAINETVRRTVLFAHYFKTMSKAMATQIAHPIENLGANVNAATLAALTAAASYGYQEFTGNPNAQVRLPGELGLAKQLYESGKQVVNGQLPSVATNRINPVAKEIAQQTFNHDLFTGKSVGNNAGTRLGHAANTLIAPEAMGSKVTQGKRSLTEIAANELGLTTPHARGYQAAPNQSFLNTPKAIVSKTGDPTGYKQQQAYFKNLNDLKNQFNGSDTATKDALNKYLDRSHDPITGQSIQNSPADTVENSGALATNDKLRAAVQKFEKSQPQHDPMWDLSPDKLQYLMTYKAQLEGSAEKNVLKAEATDPKTGDNWITDLQKAQQTFYNNLPKIPRSKGSEANPQTPAYPTFDKQTTDLLAAYNSATPDQRSQLIKDNPGELSAAFNAIAKWTNNMRKAQTGKNTPQLNIYPEASAAVQKIIDTYNAIPKGGGKRGGNLFRAQWIQANPGAYAQMQNYLSQTSMYSLIKNAALAQFQGTTASQQLLKDIKNVGQFDIARTKNADGTTSYSINPAAAFAEGGGSSGFSSSTGLKDAYARLKASVKADSEARGLAHAARAAKHVAPKNFTYAKRPTVFIKGAPKTNLHKVKVAGIYRKSTPKIKLKATPSGNKVKLKV